MSPQQQKKIIDELVDGGNPGYKELHDLYTGDDQFKAVSTAVCHAGRRPGWQDTTSVCGCHRRTRGNGCRSSTPTAIT